VLSVPRPLAPGDRVRLVLGGPVFRVERVTADAVSLRPEAKRIAVDHYGRRFSVTAGAVDVSPRFAPAELLETTVLDGRGRGRGTGHGARDAGHGDGRGT
jgi:hypothetical protein